MRLSLTIVALLILAGCSSTNSPLPSSSVYFPLAVGNQWIYTVRDDNYTTVYTYQDSVKVASSVSRSGVTWYLVIGLERVSLGADTMLVRPHANGDIYCLWNNEERPLLKFSDTVTHNPQPILGDTVAYGLIVLAKGLTVTSPMRTWKNCVELGTRPLMVYPSLSASFSFAPGVGPVSFQASEEVSSWAGSLSSFSVNPQSLP